MQYGARYDAKDWAAFGNFITVGICDAHFLRRVNDRVNLATELHYDMRDGQSTAQCGAEFTLKQSRFMTNVDDSGKVSSSLESSLGGGAKFLLSATVNHAAENPAEKYQFGFGVMFG
jgi:mitochondrial import receptor subunit TOM40